MIEPVTEPCAFHGEGPVWHTDWGGLRWVDMLAGDVLTLDARTDEVTRAHVGSVAAALRPRRAGGAVLAVERGFALADDTLTEIEWLNSVWDDPAVRMNEGGCDPDGRFYCGSMAYDAKPEAGTLFRLNLDATVTPVLTGVTISNGLVWSPDNSTAYYVDTPKQRIDMFDYIHGELTERRVFTWIDPAEGAPDGLTVDSTGGIWVALWGGGAVHHYTTDGRLADVVEVPAPRVTACTFGGPELAELYITTSKVDTDLDTYPLAGSLFRTSVPEVGGLPARTYDG